LKKYFIEFQFDGTNYHGYQQQDNVISIQEVLEAKLSILLQEKTTLIGASRTDTGVHIMQSFAHFETDKKVPIELMKRLNFMLPPDIAIKQFGEAPANFHSRFDAYQRQYIYHIHYQKNPFLINKSYYFPYQELDIQLMNAACDYIKTQRDFKSFCKRNSNNKTTLCHIKLAEWRSTGPSSICFEVHADRFLRGMVRGLVGTMMKVGMRKLALADFIKLMESGDNRTANFAVPGCGLYLTAVKYPEGRLPLEATV
jgi:tRNA pseudouridine38-40 synthase